MNKLSEINVQEKLNGTRDLNEIRDLLEYVKYKENVIKFDVDVLLEEVDEENINKIIDLIELAGEVIDDGNLLEKIYYNTKMTNRLIKLKMIAKIWNTHNITINDYQLILNGLVIEQSEINYFLSNLLANCLEMFDNAQIMDDLLAKAEELKNIQLLSGIPSKCLGAFDAILMKSTYWQLIINNLKTNDGEKFALHLLKVSLHILSEKEYFSSENEEISFNGEGKADYLKAFNAFVNLLEISKEKQLHLIEPSLKLLYELNALNSIWSTLIYRKFFTHSQSSIRNIVLLIYFRNCNTLHNDLLNALNQSDFLMKQPNELKSFLLKLSDAQYEQLVEESLLINWKPITFWSFYKTILNYKLPHNQLLGIVQKVKKLPLLYIRYGCMHLIYEKMLENNEYNYEIILEYLCDDHFKCYALKLIDEGAIVDEKQLLSECLSYSNRYRIDLLVEYANCGIRKELINELYDGFKRKLYSHQVLDRLTYLYVVTLNDLQDYLSYRLDVVDEETICVCHIDKPNSGLLRKAKSILLADYSDTQYALAFEILYYSTDKNILKIFKHWMEKILTGNLNSILAEHFANLLLKMQLKDAHFLCDNLLKIYHIFLSTQTNRIVAKVFQNLSLLFQLLNESHLDFLAHCLQKLKELKGSDCFEMAARIFIRNVAIHYNSLERNNIATFIMRNLYELAKESESILYFSVQYFKSIKTFHSHEYLLYGKNLDKNERMEYDVCLEIYLMTHKMNNPYFRIPEIHKWTLENILMNASVINLDEITNQLITNYMKTFQKRYFPNSMIHLEKLRIMQSFAFLIPHLSANGRKQLMHLLLECFQHETSQQTSVRHTMQYNLIELVKEERNESDLIDMLQSASTISGFIPILYALERIRNDFNFTTKLIDKLMEFTMGANFKLRLYSQMIIDKICERNATNRKFITRYGNVHLVIKNVLKATNKDATSGIQLDLDIMDYILSMNNNNPKELIYLICVLIPEKSHLYRNEWEYFKIKNAWKKYVIENIPSKEEEQLSLNLIDNTKIIQKKIVVAPLECRNELNNFILVTSLIESTPNLGGLARTCEIFGVKEFVLSNALLINDKEFQSLSVSSERWLNVIQVKVGNELEAYLSEMKRNGYFVIGAEQTTDSVSLEKFQFPQKSLLLLGNEKYGIPSNYLPLLDVCVEIPQFGVVRSLNVHVAGAMFIWEYAKIHLIK